jgi:hypothetical protein
LVEFATNIERAGVEMAEIGRKPHLARSLQLLLHRRGRSDGARSGRQTMTFNLSSIQNATISLVGALVAATLFISAAVGPAAQLV